MDLCLIKRGMSDITFAAIRYHIGFVESLDHIVWKPLAENTKNAHQNINIQKKSDVFVFQRSEKTGSPFGVARSDNPLFATQILQ